MSYIDEGYDAFLVQEDSQLFSDVDFNSQSPFDFDSYVQDSAVTTAKIKTISAEKIITGTLGAGTEISVGDNNVKISGDGTIIINDGSDDRVLIGYDGGEGLF